ncbi:tripartite tricarboxylate transporter TctB family protein [Blastococcus brunescens]|uniref:Tripartite tricarboxylate transporter TctB family protein n=1 Tax=Blastococcus brunescens TaxID=1564165 RepID=A0ABZ1B2I8_9ACTN|nr:tripartite tricarboxylate transporter TctB family protein [Blastococcus sp. BMG 8361]WRL63559.1 tripartite tricarboxylate transporter TctB family protein [Blastococcus sp. BMG 8361]
MTSDSERSLRKWPMADLVATVALVALFAWALWASTEWSLRAALFPRMVTAFGLALALFHLILLLARWRAGSGATGDHGVAPISDAEDDPLDYAFATAGRRAWTVSLAWIAAFFLALYVLGVYVTAPLFTVSYLRLTVRASWRLSVTYAVVVGVVLYAVFEWLLTLPKPEGLFL